MRTTVKILEQEVMTAKEVKQVLRVDRTTIWRYGRNGLLNPIKIGRRNYYKVKEIKVLFKIE